MVKHSRWGTQPWKYTEKVLTGLKFFSFVVSAKFSSAYIFSFLMAWNNFFSSTLDVCAVHVSRIKKSVWRTNLTRMKKKVILPWPRNRHSTCFLFVWRTLTFKAGILSAMWGCGLRGSESTHDYTREFLETKLRLKRKRCLMRRTSFWMTLSRSGLLREVSEKLSSISYN